MKRTEKNRGKGRSDRITMFGTAEFCLIQTGTTGQACISTGEVKSLSLLNIADRPGVAATIYSRFRFTRLRFRYVPQIGSTTAGAFSIGILDDTDDSAAGPATYAGVSSLRKATETQVWQKTSFDWTPMDFSKWYYPSPETANSVERFQIPCSLWGFGLGLAASTTYGTVLLDYTIQFEGATSVYTL